MQAPTSKRQGLCKNSIALSKFHRIVAQKPRRCFLAGKQPVQLMRKKKSLLSETALDFWDFVLDHFNLPPDGED